MSLALQVTPSVQPRAAARRTSIVVVLALVAGTIASLLAAGPVAAWDEDLPSAASETELAVLTNQSRASAGLPVLVSDAALVEFARARSRDMAERDYFSHEIAQTGTMVFDVMEADGYCFRVAGENIGWLGGGDDGAEARIQAMFLESPTHRTVLMGDDWNAMGVGTFKRADGRKYWAVLFADRCADAAAAQPVADTAAHRSMRVGAAAQPGFVDSLIGGITGRLLGT